MRIKRFVSILSKELGIPEPKIQRVEELNTPTQLAAADIANETIYIKNNTEDARDSYFAIAHELRHMYQAKYTDSIESHIEVGTVDVAEYNMQPSEIDANAYALIAMQNIFGVTAQFNGMPKEIVDMICERANQIEK